MSSIEYARLYILLQKIITGGMPVLPKTWGRSDILVRQKKCQAGMPVPPGNKRVGRTFLSKNKIMTGRNTCSTG